MFWKFGYNNYGASGLEQLLDKNDLTLEELLNEDELLQEAKSQNKKLIDYLSKPEVLKELLSLTIAENLDENKQYNRYPYIASELICCDIWPMYENLVTEKYLLKEYWKYLDRKRPLNPLTASYFCKVNGILLQKMTKDEQDGLVGKIVTHMNTSAIAEFLLKLVDMEDSLYDFRIVSWLQQQGLIKHLFNMLDPKLDSESHSMASQTIVDLIAITYINAMNKVNRECILFQDIKSKESMTKLVDFMTLEHDHSTSTLIFGIDILIELMRRSILSRTMDGIPAELTCVDETIEVLSKRISKFNEIFKNPKSLRGEINTTVGKMIPLGAERLKLCELFAELFRLQSREINLAMIENKVLFSCLDLFFEFQWNNFLHSTVCDMLINVFGGPPESNKELILSVFRDAKISQRIVYAQKLNDATVAKPRGLRLGYMGQVTIIVDEILKLLEEQPEYKDLLAEYIKDDDWQEFINKAYHETKQRDSQPLGGQKPDVESNILSDLGAEQEQLARFLTQKITNDLPDTFFFTDEIEVMPNEINPNEIDFLGSGNEDENSEEETVDETIASPVGIDESEDFSPTWTVDFETAFKNTPQQDLTISTDQTVFAISPLESNLNSLVINSPMSPRDAEHHVKDRLMKDSHHVELVRAVSPRVELSKSDDDIIKNLHIDEVDLDK
ncbi:SIT4 phosphatase-associated protein family domain-containing protein [Rozella allomycis CSF55]|uniref:SIT4 phosphatase-associated protein family domain-containing protein n=1 Tax=Rozella allomycis (strain CSF55) TaxID=988480 RepID=A0A075B1D7_ROZAC|nr:SIT4 phosphatase-associated protein family domain-containing protein [Rozella allomycis CSF55]|eukprot:EPZ34588.1 SIT4 phosphatase-associated protein family domain-containing protein [Rozella allomycis CSF55]